jgi:hypothetical protein
MYRGNKGYIMVEDVDDATKYDNHPYEGKMGMVIC